MKKGYLLLLSLTFGLFSCSNEEIATDLENSSTEVETRSMDGKHRMLGYGYDVTGDNLNKKSIRNPVIDADRMAAETKHTVIYDPETGGENYYYYGYSSEDYVKEISEKTGYKASVTVNGGNSDTSKVFGGNIKYNKEFDATYSHSTKYSFATADITKYVSTMRIAETVPNMTKFVTAKFLVDLKELSPALFVENYGTHVLTHITTGGHLQIIYRSAIIDERNYSRKKEIVKSGLNATLKKIGLSADIEKETEIKETLTKQNKEQRLYIKYKSGTGVGGTYNLEMGHPTIDKHTWEASVNERIAGLVEINWEKTYPIYDFISDPVKKAQIKKAVEDYIKSKQINSLEVKPLHKIWNPNYKDGFNVFSWEEVLQQQQWGNKYEGIEGYILAKEQPNTRPFYRMWNPNNKDGFHVVNWNDVTLQQSWGNKYEGIDGYVFINEIADTYPVYRMWNPNNKDGFNVFKWNDVTLQQSWGNKYNGIDGYIYKP